MNRTKFINGLYWSSLILWLLVSAYILSTGTLISPTQTFTSKYDSAYYIKLGEVLLFHALAFSSIPILIIILNKYSGVKISEIKFITFAAIAPLVITFQWYARGFGNFSLSESNRVLPNKLNDTITLFTILMLLILYIVFVLRLKPRLDAIANPKIG